MARGLRIVLADDSATARELLRGILEASPDLKVVGEAEDGMAAVSMVEQLRPDVVVMDVHMPRANGLEATREIMSRTPTPIVIVSSVNTRDVDLSLTATQAGAVLALPKPVGPAAPHYAAQAEQLRAMVRAMAEVKVVRHWNPRPAPAAPVRPRRSGRPQLVAIAASTGGPAALRALLHDLPPAFPLPITIVQHIAQGFTDAFVRWLAAETHLDVRIPEHGEKLVPGRVYVAPDARHLTIAAGPRARLLDTAPVSGFRPSATCLFNTAARAVGDGLIAVVLTGMGSDGVDGLQLAVERGATVIAQDEATSVVFGMAQEAVRRGLADAVLPIERIAPSLVQLSRHVERES